MSEDKLLDLEGWQRIGPVRLSSDEVRRRMDWAANHAQSRRQGLRALRTSCSTYAFTSLGDWLASRHVEPDSRVEGAVSHVPAWDTDGLKRRRERDSKFRRSPEGRRGCAGSS